VLATTILFNAGKSTNQRCRGESQGRTGSGYLPSSRGGVLDARFDKFDCSPTVSYAGNYLSSAPKLTLNGTVRYSTEVNDKLGFFAQVDAMSRHYLAIYNVD